MFLSVIIGFCPTPFVKILIIDSKFKSVSLPLIEVFNCANLNGTEKSALANFCNLFMSILLVLKEPITLNFDFLNEISSALSFLANEPQVHLTLYRQNLLHSLHQSQY